MNPSFWSNYSEEVDTIQFRRILPFGKLIRAFLEKNRNDRNRNAPVLWERPGLGLLHAAAIGIRQSATSISVGSRPLRRHSIMTPSYPGCMALPVVSATCSNTRRLIQYPPCYNTQVPQLRFSTQANTYSDRSDAVVFTQVGGLFLGVPERSCTVRAGPELDLGLRWNSDCFLLCTAWPKTEILVDRLSLLLRVRAIPYL